MFLYLKRFQGMIECGTSRSRGVHLGENIKGQEEVYGRNHAGPGGEDCIETAKRDVTFD